jgi:DNA-directed RNA polymerase subunit L
MDIHQTENNLSTRQETISEQEKSRLKYMYTELLKQNHESRELAKLDSDFHTLGNVLKTKLLKIDKIQSYTYSSLCRRLADHSYFHCCVCNDTFLTPNELIVHKNSSQCWNYHEELREIKQKLYVCRMCDCVYLDFKAIIIHIVTEFVVKGFTLPTHNMDLSQCITILYVEQLYTPDMTVTLASMKKVLSEMSSTHEGIFEEIDQLYNQIENETESATLEFTVDIKGNDESEKLPEVASPKVTSPLLNLSVKNFKISQRTVQVLNHPVVGKSVMLDDKPKDKVQIINIGGLLDPETGEFMDGGSSSEIKSEEPYESDNVVKIINVGTIVSPINVADEKKSPIISPVKVAEKKKSPISPVKVANKKKSPFIAIDFSDDDTMTMDVPVKVNIKKGLTEIKAYKPPKLAKEPKVSKLVKLPKVAKLAKEPKALARGKKAAKAPKEPKIPKESKKSDDKDADEFKICKAKLKSSIITPRGGDNKRKITPKRKFAIEDMLDSSDIQDPEPLETESEEEEEPEEVPEEDEPEDDSSDDEPQMNLEPIVEITVGMVGGKQRLGKDLEEKKRRKMERDLFQELRQLMTDDGYEVRNTKSGKSQLISWAKEKVEDLAEKSGSLQRALHMEKARSLKLAELKNQLNDQEEEEEDDEDSADDVIESNDTSKSQPPIKIRITNGRSVVPIEC